jgi:hypothetical protein
MWWRRSPPLQGGVIQRYSLRDRCVDEHTTPCLDLELICGVSGLQSTDITHFRNSNQTQKVDLYTAISTSNPNLLTVNRRLETVLGAAGLPAQAGRFGPPTRPRLGFRFSFPVLTKASTPTAWPVAPRSYSRQNKQTKPHISSRRCSRHPGSHITTACVPRREAHVRVQLESVGD